MNGNIPVPYPAANKQLQLRLTNFVSKGHRDEQIQIQIVLWIFLRTMYSFVLPCTDLLCV